MSLLRPLVLAGVIAGTLCAPRVATAGPFIDDLSRCLVTKSTEADKMVLVQWIFSMIALHPGVASMSEISDAQREELSRKGGKLFEVLVTDRCKAEAQLAVKHEGAKAFEASFKVLGEIAAGGLFADPSVAAGSEKLASYIDEKKLAEVFKDTASAAPPAPAKPQAK